MDKLNVVATRHVMPKWMMWQNSSGLPAERTHTYELSPELHWYDFTDVTDGQPLGAAEDLELSAIPKLVALPEESTIFPMPVPTVHRPLAPPPVPPPPPPVQKAAQKAPVQNAVGQKAVGQKAVVRGNGRWGQKTTAGPWVRKRP